MLTGAPDSVATALAARRSVRAFRPDPVDPGIIAAALAAAQAAPSGGNLQPWRVAVLAGAPLARLKADARAAVAAGPAGLSFDHAIYPPALDAVHDARRRAVGQELHAALGIARGDQAGRQAQLLRNFDGFGAPLIIFCALPADHGPAQWADAGMWLQSLILLLTAAGLATCPQSSWAMVGPLVRAACGLADEWRLWTGLAVGHADADHPANRWRAARAPLAEVVSWHGLPPPAN